MTIAGIRTEALDVVLLLDDPSELAGRPDGQEIFPSTSALADVLEPTLERLGHRPRRASFAMGIPSLIAHLDAQPPDVVVHVGHAVQTGPAREAQITALLDLLRIPHISESPEMLMFARDKFRAKALFAQAGIPSACYAVSLQGELPDALPRAPWIAKPTLEDGSVGIPCAAPTRGRSQLAERVRALHALFAQPILIESFVGGREFEIGMLGGEMLPIVEVDFSRLPLDRPRMVGYETKWQYESVEFQCIRRVCPALASDGLTERLQALARRTAEVFGVQRCTRLDIRMDEQDGLHVLDVNPNPDLSPGASLHLMAQATEWGFDGFVQRLLDLASSNRTYRP